MIRHETLPIEGRSISITTRAYLGDDVVVEEEKALESQVDGVAGFLQQDGIRKTHFCPPEAKVGCRLESKSVCP